MIIFILSLFNELKLEVKKSIKKVKIINYENYFEYAYNKKNNIIKKRNTRKIKNYKYSLL